ncbi:hypothetical protein [uncultured Rikenella sp.]|uniref:hypothetical protein n=1 Tax=uncultured Rikenella sp. TaxID=368003 RepID=UPI0025D00F13|nr:hypothetical protein [uncultured Rikenella sp.]
MDKIFQGARTENGTWSDFTRATDLDQPLTGTFPYYSDGKAGEKYTNGDYKATNGRLYKVSSDGTAGTPLAWYPAPGYRDFGRTGWEGIARGIGNNGCSWSCTPVTGDVTVRYLAFGTQDLYPSYAHNRAHGFQLRCLSE